MKEIDWMAKAKLATEGELFRGLDVLTSSEHAVVLKVLVILGELDERRAYATRAYPSMFELCVAGLKYSEGQACRRIKAARAIRKFPALFERLATKAITLTNLASIQKHLTLENHMRLADAVGTQRTRDVERILATWFPQAEKKPVIRKITGEAPPSLLPVQTQPLQSQMDATQTLPQMRTMATDVAPVSESKLAPPPLPSPPLPSPPPAVVKAVSESRYRAHFTMTSETHERLERIRARTKGCAEAGDLDRLMERAIRLLEEDVNRRVRAEVKGTRAEKAQSAKAVKVESAKAAKVESAKKVKAEDAWSNAELMTNVENAKATTTSKPKPKPKPRLACRKRAISRPTKRLVFRRDENRCTFLAEDGRRCSAREFLEIDHIVPRARGGDDSEANLRVRCRAHNRLTAEADFGRDYIARKIEAHRDHRR